MLAGLNIWRAAGSLLVLNLRTVQQMPAFNYFFQVREFKQLEGAKMKRQKQLHPINGLYLSWLRDTGQFNRPTATWTDKQTGQIFTTDRLMSEHWHIYMVLLSRADIDTLKCWPPISKLMHDTGYVDRRFFWRRISELEQMQIVSVERRKGTANIYYMLDFANWRDSQPGT